MYWRMGRTACLWSMALPKPGVSMTLTRTIVFVASSKRSKQRLTSTCFVLWWICGRSPSDALWRRGFFWSRRCQCSKSMSQHVVLPSPDRPDTMTLNDTTRGFSRSDATSSAVGTGTSRRACFCRNAVASFSPAARDMTSVSASSSSGNASRSSAGGGAGGAAAASSVASGDASTSAGGGAGGGAPPPPPSIDVAAAQATSAAHTTLSMAITTARAKSSELCEVDLIANSRPCRRERRFC